jgi:hypothetical protein
VNAFRRQHALVETVPNITIAFCESQIMTRQFVHLDIPAAPPAVSILALADCAVEVLAARKSFQDNLVGPRMVRVKGKTYDIQWKCQMCDDPQCPAAEIRAIPRK